MQFLADYGLFLIKTLTIVVAILIVIAGIVAISSKGKDKGKQKIKIKHINEKFKSLAKRLHQEIASKSEFKKYLKQQKQASKGKKQSPQKKRLFVLKFDGDIRASGVENLREEITAILTVAKKEDEVLALISSPGGLVNSYGLCASQLVRIRNHGITLTVAIDKVAASGGYMMSCVANKILAAPFAIVGSIGVVAQLPNFHRLLKDKNIDYELHTAGQYKRTITTFGENTDEARNHLKQQLEDTHELFKRFITEFRPQVDLDEVATGDYWYAKQALSLKLVDELTTSDDYLMTQAEQADIYEIRCESKKPLVQKLMQQAELAWGWMTHRF